MHINRRSAKVKVYGVNSTKEVRARLIELLMERVRYHKDKFIAPILHKEMASMQVKKSGKVEHSDNSHDDQVFSYLMALYVWYDGKNLAENFHIIKNTLKTDADDDLEELDIEDSLEKREKLDADKLMYDPDDEKIRDLQETLDWVEKDAQSYMDTNMLAQKQRDELFHMKSEIISNSPNLRQKIIDETGVDVQSYYNNGSPYVNLPNSLFGVASDEDDLDWSDDNYDVTSTDKYSYLQGNLSNIFSNIR
ncbi:MAG: hypothetical protein IKR19_08565 [Acholeplasmatales bacterium]|nr:hypothetical protein [Acholeplasmatales bacterium]